MEKADTSQNRPDTEIFNLLLGNKHLFDCFSVSFLLADTRIPTLPVITHSYCGDIPHIFHRSSVDTKTSSQTLFVSLTYRIIWQLHYRKTCL